MAAARGLFNLTASSQPLQLQQRQYYSPWQSPIPYLFGGLASMFGLVAFALLLLACFYRRLSGRFDEGNGNGSGRGDIEAGEVKDDGVDEGERKEPVFEEMRVVVIMAGEDEPTFLAKATPKRSSRASYICEHSGGSGSCLSGGNGADDHLENGMMEMKQGRCPEDDTFGNV